MKFLMAQEQGLSKGSKNLSGPITPGPRVLVSPFERHYLSHKISISSDEKRSSYPIKYNVKSGYKKILLTMQYQLSLLTVPIYYLPQPHVLCTIIYNSRDPTTLQDFCEFCCRVSSLRECAF